MTSSIVSASNAPYSGDRNEALERIAANPKLSPTEQHYLLAVLLRLKGFSSDTSDVLVALANNPASTMETRTMTDNAAAQLSLFSRDKLKVTKALEDYSRVGRRENG